MSYGASMCTCGHVGDVPSDATGKVVLPNTHAGLLGHGYCKMPGCDCGKFTWERRLTKADTRRKKELVR